MLLLLLCSHMHDTDPAVQLLGEAICGHDRGGACLRGVGGGVLAVEEYHCTVREGELSVSELFV